MAKIRTLVELQAALDQEMSWRVKEIMTFRVGSKKNGVERKYYIRAGITLMYAHWEGFIKKSTEAYLYFVNDQNLTYRDLKSCFAIFGLKSKLHFLNVSRQSKANIVAFDFIVNNLDNIANLNLSSAIDTESNLTSKVFTNIATSIDINTLDYQTKFNLIDESLVNRRNKIAHGEYLDLDGKEFGELSDEVLNLMRNYKKDLENAASLATYKRPVTAVN